jgi:DNA-directed RNA polymerase subunit RPC12/RpoP
MTKSCKDKLIPVACHKCGKRISYICVNCGRRGTHSRARAASGGILSMSNS